MIKLELEIEEVNTILRVLSQHPFKEVADLIGKIREQGQPQADEQTAESNTEAQ